jgi:hypothetical protein
MAVFLASKQARNVSGLTINVDGVVLLQSELELASDQGSTSLVMVRSRLL